MAALLFIVIAGLFGVFGHWYTRFLQGRTESSFWHYLSTNRADTISSLMGNLSASFTIYTQTGDDIHGKALALVLMGAYMAGYTLDSKLNSDAGAQ